MHTKTDAKDYGILEQKVTALRLFKKFPGLKEQFWKGKLWSPSNYVGTEGKVSSETIEKYIDVKKK
jgi:REP element-mobilizing transposase RayT